MVLEQLHRVWRSPALLFEDSALQFAYRASPGDPHRHLAGDRNCVAIDTREAARIGVEHLIAMGHRRIGHLAGRLGRFNGDMRRQGWQQALEAAGLDHADRRREAALLEQLHLEGALLLGEHQRPEAEHSVDEPLLVGRVTLLARRNRLDRGAAHLKDEMMPRYAELIYNGFWFSPEREMLQAAIDLASKRVTGTVRLKLYKGNVIVTGRKSPSSLYDEDMVTFEEDSVYDQRDAEGFIKLNALRLRMIKRLSK